MPGLEGDTSLVVLAMDLCLSLSENHLEDEGCRLMAEAAARLHITGKLDLSNNSLSMSGLHYMLQAASGCQMLVELYISLLHSAVVFSFAPKLKESTGSQKREFLHSPQIQFEQPTCTRKIRYYGPCRPRVPACSLEV